MNVGELVQQRRENWRQLDDLCQQLESRRRRKLTSDALLRFAALYRAACADLALAEAYQLPPAMIAYLHRLVGRSHNQLYRSRKLNLAAWRTELLQRVPRRLLRDRCVWASTAIFWGVFLFSMLLAAEVKVPFTDRPLVPDFAKRLLGEDAIQQVEEEFQTPLYERTADQSAKLTAFYIANNTGIGLKCFALGLLFGVGGLFEIVFNAAYLGCIFGHMFLAGPARANFFNFVTAHGPFELTAIVLSAAAGMRLGFSLINTGGRTRIGALQETMYDALPIMVAAGLMFTMAAAIEAFISPSNLPYFFKAAVAVVSAALLIMYFVVLGWPPIEAAKENTAGNLSS